MNLIDSLLSYFAPGLALKRQKARLQLRFISAAQSQSASGWANFSEQNFTRNIILELPTLRKRVKDLVMNFPVFAHVCDTIAADTVGTGIRFRSEVKDIELAAKIENAIEWAIEELDASGKLHGYELMRLAKREMLRSGEFLFIKTSIKDPKRCVNYALLMVDPSELSSTPAKNVQKGAEFIDGIEYDPQTYRIIAYHFQDITKPKRITANNVLHGFTPLFPRQLRGVSVLAPAVLLANDLDDYLTAELQATKLASKYLGFVESDDISTFQKLRAQTEDGKTFEDLENAILEYLRPGEKITLASPQRPTSNFSPFVSFLLRLIALAANLPYEYASNDYSDVNYTSLRAIRGVYQSFIRIQQFEIVQHFCIPVIRDILTEAYLSSRIDLPGYTSNPRKYWEGSFLFPKVEAIDPVRETKADIDQIKAGLKSPQEITAARGKDYEAVVGELAGAREILKKYGMSLDAMLAEI